MLNFRSSYRAPSPRHKSYVIFPRSLRRNTLVSGLSLDFSPRNSTDISKTLVRLPKPFGTVVVRLLINLRKLPAPPFWEGLAGSRKPLSWRSTPFWRSSRGIGTLGWWSIVAAGLYSFLEAGSLVWSSSGVQEILALLQQQNSRAKMRSSVIVD